MTEGVFIVVEGIDGSGSTTVTERLAAHVASKRRAVHRTCEPSSGPIGSLIRQILAHRIVVPTEFGTASPSWATMGLLFAADRLDHLEAEVVPRLREGVIVISDRYDLSSLAYQTATAPTDDPEEARRIVEWIRQLNQRARRPDLTIVLDVNPEVAAERRQGRGGARELYEDAELQARLAKAYATAEQLIVGDFVAHVDANASIDDVVAAAAALVDGLLGR